MQDRNSEGEKEGRNDDRGLGIRLEKMRGERGGGSSGTRLGMSYRDMPRISACLQERLESQSINTLILRHL